MYYRDEQIEKITLTFKDGRETVLDCCKVITLLKEKEPVLLPLRDYGINFLSNYEEPRWPREFLLRCWVNNFQDRS